MQYTLAGGGVDKELRPKY